MNLECQDAEQENVFQECFEYLIETEGIQYPTMYGEACNFNTANIIAFSKH